MAEFNQYWIVRDDEGVITQTTDEDEARQSFEEETDFSGDLELLQCVAVRR